MSSGFIKLRRGIIEHLQSGRMTADEFCVFSLLLPLADFRSGTWQGSGVALSTYLSAWSLRKCQRVLKSLAGKGYITLRSMRGKMGNYPIVIHNFHEPVEKVTTPETPVAQSDDTRDATLPKVTTPAPTLQEVIQEVKIRSKPAQVRRVRHIESKIEQEQRRKIEAKQKRQHDETELRMEVYAGRGPVCAVPGLWGQIKELAAKKAL